MNVLEDFKLIIEEENGDIKPINVKFRVPSAKVKSDLDTIETKKIERLTELDVKTQDLKEKLDTIQLQAGGNEALLGNLIASNADLSIAVLNKMNEAERITRNFYIKKMQAIINIKQQVTENQKLINEPETSDFWQNQDYCKLCEAVDFFIGQYPKIMIR